MLFNSIEYIFIFLPIVFFLYFLLARFGEHLSKIVLFFASLSFYAYWDVSYLPLLLFSILINYFIGGRIQAKEEKRKKRLYFASGVLLNIGILVYFKYTNFLLVGIYSVIDAGLEPFDIILPLAISFFTFQQIAYLSDCYKGERASYNFLDYAVFVCFFPQLIAGPIVHHKEMMPQFSKPNSRNINLGNLVAGLFIFCLGLFKKMVVADTFSIWANTGFDYQGTLGFFEAWGASLSYSLQLYYDFSGYSDMAIGAALLFNIRLPQNFNSPYKALSIREFWRRWHMTLSRWLRDYVYIPLGGSKGGRFYIYRNLLLTFLIGGLWHGAGWNFVIWGVLHGCALVLHRIWNTLGYSMSKAFAWICTLLFVNFTWVFFRAEDFDTAISIISSMIGINGIALSSDAITFLSLIFGMDAQQILKFDNHTSNSLLGVETAIAIITAGYFALFTKNSMELSYYVNSIGDTNYSLSWRKSVLLSVVVFMLLVNTFGGITSNEFLYFNF